MADKKGEVWPVKKMYILHGWTYDLEKWRKFEKLLRVKGCDPVLLKIPGLTAKSDKIWNLDKYSNWLAKQIDEPKTILLGHSNGGRIAAHFASQHPDRIEKLILIDSAGIYHKELALEIKRFLFGSIAKLGKKFTKSEVLRKFLYKLVGEKDYEQASPTMRKTMPNLIKSDLTHEFEKIKAQTLIIWGKDDKITPVADGRLINRLIKNSKLRVVEGARHSPFYTHPNEVAKIITNDI